MMLRALALSSPIRISSASFSVIWAWRSLAFFPKELGPVVDNLLMKGFYFSMVCLISSGSSIWAV
jgi:hypothetical protein